MYLMQVFISPSKSMTNRPAPPFISPTTPVFEEEANTIVYSLQNLPLKKLAATLNVSKPLAELNFLRYKNWDNTEPKSALWTYSGDVYNGVDSFSFDQKTYNRSNKMLWIISGLYGLLRPSDLIKPYRFEMRLKYNIDGKPDLYSYWSDRIILALKGYNEPFLLCASNEYADLIRKNLPNEDIRTVRFYQKTEKGLKEKGLFSKYLRGVIARFAIDTDAQKFSDITKCTLEGLVYSPELSDSKFITFIVPPDYTLKGRFKKL